MKPLVSFRNLQQLLGRDRKDIERIASHVGRFYKPFDTRPKGTTKDWRHISNPIGELKNLQKKILRNILSSLVLPDTFFGAVKGRTARESAKKHVGQPNLVTLDLEKCFVRINDKTVFKTYCTVFKCSVEIAALLTKLTTFQHQLPQGAPTSSALANACLVPLYSTISDICNKMDLEASFYVDDITISGARSLEAINPVIKSIQKHGYSARRKKMRLMPNFVSQQMVGLTINKKISVGRKYKERLCEQILELSMKNTISRGEFESVKGKIKYIYNVCPSQGEVIAQFANRHWPTQLTEGKHEIKYETRPCKGAHSHRPKVQ